jgi:hypothetical protein
MKISIILVTSLFIATPAFAWHTNTHLQMTRDAYSFMPPDFQKFFKDNIKVLEPGVRDPDEVLGDFQNHYYLADTHEGGAIDRIDSIISTLDTKLKSGMDREAARQFCYLAHYIGDLWTPESLIKKDQRPNQNFIFDTPIIVLFEGYQYPIKNYQMYLQERSSYRWTLENSESISSLLYSEAVNDIAQAWLSVWHRSGKSIKPLDPLMIAHNKEHLPIVYNELPFEAVQKAKLHALIQKQKEKKDPQGAQAEKIAAQNAAKKLEDFQKTNAIVKPLLSSGPEIGVLESSLKTIGNDTYFVTRLLMKGTKPIKNFSVSCRGQEKNLIEVEDFNPGEVVKLQTILPANITKNDLQYRYFEK